MDMEGRRTIYLDHAATTPLHPEVKKAMEPFLQERFGNPSTLYSLGREAREAVEQARERVALGSHIAAMGFANSGLGAVHGLAHPVGVVAGAPHGVVCGLLLPVVMEFNLQVAKHKYAKLAQVMGLCSFPETNPEEAAKLAIEAIRRLLAELGLPRRLRELGLERAQLKEIAENTPSSGSLRFNPRPASPEDLLSILEAAF